MATQINTELFERYVRVSRELLAHLSQITGESYNPEPEISEAIQKVRAISGSVLALVASLHPYQPPFNPNIVEGPPPNPTAMVPPSSGS